MQELNKHELNQVFGAGNAEDVAANAQVAVGVCGAGNVKSVTATGFECK